MYFPAMCGAQTVGSCGASLKHRLICGTSVMYRSICGAIFGSVTFISLVILHVVLPLIRQSYN